jgi:hypothetical protein
VGQLAAKEQALHMHSHVHLHDPWLAMGFLTGRIGLNINFLALFKLLYPFKRLPSKTRIGITEHGFGAYYQAVRWDGVQIAPVLSFLLRHL